MIDRYNQPASSHSDSVALRQCESFYLQMPPLAGIRDSPSSFPCNLLLLPLVLHFDPDLVIDVCVQGRGGFRSSEENQNYFNCVI